MCACRVECPSLSSSPGQRDLEEYIISADREMDGQKVVDTGGGYGEDPGQPECVEDFQAILEQKDSDLRLAAELGKALLERNIDLEKRHEQLAEEYSSKIEDLEQERHALHLKLESLGGEYENTVKELQYDINLLRRDLDSKHKDNETEEREKAQRVRELSQQNDRLNEELQQSAQRQDELEEELKFLKERGFGQATNIGQNQLEALEQEVATLSKRHGELERQLSHVTDEKEGVLCCMEEAQDRVRVLERQKQELEEQSQSKTLEIRELQQTNSRLTLQLEQLSDRTPDGSAGYSQTLFNELSEISALHDLPMSTDGHSSFRLDMFSDDDDIECDDDDCLMMSDTSPSMLQEMSSVDTTVELEKLKEEAGEAYKHLTLLCEDIRAQLGHQVISGADSGTANNQPNSEEVSLVPTISQLRDLVTDALRKEKAPSHLTEICALQGRVGELERDLRHCQAGIQRLQEQIHQKDIQLQEKTDKMTELSNVLNEQQTEMKKLSAERDRLQDMVLGDLDPGDVVEQARTDRDQAIARKTTMEKQLLQARLDVLTLHGQLMEAIQQKITVSQQLDQWQEFDGFHWF